MYDFLQSDFSNPLASQLLFNDREAAAKRKRVDGVWRPVPTQPINIDVSRRTVALREPIEDHLNPMLHHAGFTFCHREPKKPLPVPRITFACPSIPPRLDAPRRTTHAIKPAHATPRPLRIYSGGLVRAEIRKEYQPLKDAKIEPVREPKRVLEARTVLPTIEDFEILEALGQGCIGKVSIFERDAS